METMNPSGDPLNLRLLCVWKGRVLFLGDSNSTWMQRPLELFSLWAARSILVEAICAEGLRSMMVCLGSRLASSERREKQACGPLQLAKGVLESKVSLGFGLS